MSSEAKHSDKWGIEVQWGFRNLWTLLGSDAYDTPDEVERIIKGMRDLANRTDCRPEHLAYRNIPLRVSKLPAVSEDESEENLSMIQLETIEQDRKTFTNPDPILDRIIETESARLREAAKVIGREWIGQFSRAHVLLMAKAYYFAKQGAKQNVYD